MKCIILIFVFALMSCEKENSLKLNCVSPLKKEDFNIELHVLGSQQPITTIFDGKNQQKISNEYGENDWHISWKDSLFLNFRHFKTNKNDKHEYEFNFYKKNNLICVDVTIKGINSLHKTLIFSEKRVKVEIHFLKEVKPNKIGVKYPSEDKYDTTTYDSLTKTYYKWTDFDYTQSDLKEIPFISDDEIVSLDTLNGVIKFNNEASQRIIKITNGFQRSKQFVITVNGKPVMNGYFHNIYSSFGTDWNTIKFTDLKNMDNNDLEVYNFEIYMGKGLKNTFAKNKIYFSKYPLLIAALEKTNRIE